MILLHALSHAQLKFPFHEQILNNRSIVRLAAFVVIQESIFAYMLAVPDNRQQSRGKSLFTICNVFSVFPDCGDQFSIIKGALSHTLKGSSNHDGDEMTIATASSEDSFSRKEEAAVILQALFRGMRTRIRILAQRKQEKRARIEKTLESVHDVMRANQKIYKRCKPYIRGVRGLLETVITRVGFVSVLAITRKNAVRFSTRAERQYESFDTKCMSQLPAKLSGIFEVGREDHGFIDFRSYLERLLLFHDDILDHVLDHFKKHLQSVTETLMEIENWIREVNSHVHYLQETFCLIDELQLLEESQLSGSLAFPIQSLKTIPLETNLQLTAAFDIQQARGQNRLRQFLEYVQVNQ